MVFLLHMMVPVLSWATLDCGLLKNRACVYIPEHVGASVPLHLYHRGFHKDRRDVPEREREEVAREALLNPAYGLIPSAEHAQAVVVASGSSAVSFDLKDVAALEMKYHLKVSEVLMSAHSGGYWGLNKTLREFSRMKDRVKKILMLDSFYATEKEGLLPILREYQESKVPCLGFMTEHNQDRVEKYYLKDGIFCEVEGPQGMDHFKSVAPFLGRNL